MRKSMRRSFFHVFTVIICILVLGTCMGSAFAADTGWIEVRSDVPEGMNSYLILSIVNEKTQEDFDIAVLPDNDFYAREEVPQGTYTVAAAWVFQDYRYAVTPDAQRFTVGKDKAALVHLTVKAPQEEEAGSEIEETFEAEPFSEEVFADFTDDEKEKEDAVSSTEEEQAEEMQEEDLDSDVEMSPMVRVLILITGLGILAAASVFAALFLRRYY